MLRDRLSNLLNSGVNKTTYVVFANALLAMFQQWKPVNEFVNSQILDPQVFWPSVMTLVTGFIVYFTGNRNKE